MHQCDEPDSRACCAGPTKRVRTFVQRFSWGDRRLFRGNGTEARTGNAVMKRRSGFSSRAGESDARQVTTAGDKRDVHGELDAQVALDERPRQGTRRCAWPSRPRLEARGATSGAVPEVDLVGGS